LAEEWTISVAALPSLASGKDDVVGVIANKPRGMGGRSFLRTLGLGGRFVPMYEVELPLRLGIYHQGQRQ